MIITKSIDIKLFSLHFKVESLIMLFQDFYKCDSGRSIDYWSVLLQFLATITIIIMYYDY